MKTTLILAVLAVLGALWLANLFDKQTMEKIFERKDAQTVELTQQNQALTAHLVDQNRALTAAEFKNADRFYVMAQTNQMLVALLGVGLFIAAVIVPISFVFMLIYFRRTVYQQAAPVYVPELPYARTLIMRDQQGRAIIVVSPAKELTETKH